MADLSLCNSAVDGVALSPCVVGVYDATTTRTATLGLLSHGLGHATEGIGEVLSHQLREARRLRFSDRVGGDCI